MKKISQLIVLLVLFQNITGQEYEFLKPDLDDSCTIIKHILEKDNKQEFLVYLDKKHWTEDKKALANFKYEESNFKDLGAVCKQNLKGVKAKLLPVKLPGQWVPLYQYKGQKVLFCSPEANTAYILTDSLITESEMGGPIPMVIRETTIKNKNYHFKIIAPYNVDKEFKLIIHIINDNNKLAVWEFKHNGESGYRLLIPVSEIPNYPIISTISYDGMIEIPIGFEKINYMVLLKNNK